MNDLRSPRVFRVTSSEARQKLDDFLASKPETIVLDQIEPQLSAYLKSQHPDKEFSKEALDALMHEHLGSTDIADYGTWVYYPWNRCIVHLLDQPEFTALRTDRNKNKITAEEQAVLSGKKIGIIGLSVGHAVATTLALEGCFGELRIADHDHLELSNLNRIRTGVHNLGLNKTSIASRDIAELDPYLNVNCWDDGITEDNLREFLTGNGGLDLLIDECDSLDIKIRCREMAREQGIPVIMETSDRGMLDVERFDLEPERPLLHGLVKGLNSRNLKNLSKEELIAHVMSIIEIDSCSEELRSSMGEIGKTISTWPQLGSSVKLGGANATCVARKILLGKNVPSGRSYIDMDKLMLASLSKPN